MKSVQETSLHFNKRVKINFDGGDLSSDSGLLLYKEFDEKLGITKMIKEKINITDSSSHHTHSNHDVIMQKVYQHLAGYHTDNAADDLQVEPTMLRVFSKERLASQPTISRLNSKVDEETVNQFQQTIQCLFDRVQLVKPSDGYIFDIDSANFETTGNQENTAYNAHYRTMGFHPLFLFDGLTGDCIKAVLRSGNVYTSNGVVEFLEPVLIHFKELYPHCPIIIRGDSGFASPGLYELCEKYDVHFVIRLKANAKLNGFAQALEAQITKNLEITSKPCVFYQEMNYKAASWHTERRVIIKLEKPTDELLFTYTFIVTSLSANAKNIVKTYQNRGTMENFIKEGKNGFAFDWLSSHSQKTNAIRLQMSVLAYNFHNWFRRICLPNKVRNQTMETIRSQLIKIAGKVIRSSRYITFKLCSSCLYKDAFWQTLRNIQRLQVKIE
ncbi:IS1380 family transposase [Paenisporosarcina sp. TG20]|uniref:IS1380 family transposase n=1 Tax=Paenisporosarcina sp. TG20 TaxID=1211706 RepID=UPI00035D9FD4|nr:IS1380 family transposase [Paenisporosarcina sp. TG20]